MSGMDWEGLTPNERLIAEQSVIDFRALNVACNSAADGTVLGIAEQLVVKRRGERWRYLCGCKVLIAKKNALVETEENATQV